MASIASQLVFHPTVSQSLKFGATTLGRDKTYRAVQYFARFFSWYLLQKGDKIDAARWGALKAHLGTARKLMRLGKPMEHLQAALRASFTSGVPTLEVLTTIARQIGYFGYLSYDAIVWAPLDQLWFAGIIFSLAHGALKTARLVKEKRGLRRSKAWGEKDLAEEAARETKLAAAEAAYKSTQQQLIIDVLDVWIPATGAGLLNVNEGILGIFGLISSILGAKAQWKAVNGK